MSSPCRKSSPTTETSKHFGIAQHVEERNGYGHPPAIWIDWVELEGPLSSTPNNGSNAVKEVHANAKVGGTYNGYFKGGYEKGKAFLDAVNLRRVSLMSRKQNFESVSSRRKARSTVAIYDPLTQVGSFLTISRSIRKNTCHLQSIRPGKN